MKKLLLAFLWFAFIQSAKAQPARVQLINNAPDSLYNSVDVYVNGVKQLDNMQFQTAIPFSDMPSGIPLILGIAPENSTSVLDTFYSTTATLTAGGKYIAVLNGTEIQTGYFPARPMRLDLFNTARETATVSTNTDVLFMNGSTDIGTIDIRSGLTTIENDIAFGNFGTGYLSYPSNTPVTIRITTPTGSVTHQTYNLDMMPMTGKSAVLLTSGFMDPTLNKLGSVFSLLLVGGNGMVMNLGTAGMEDIARLQVIHNSADSKMQMVDVYMNDSLAFNNMQFHTSSPFLDAYANVPVIWGIAPANSTSVNDTFFSTEVVLSGGIAHVAVINGIESTTGYNPAEPLNVHLFNQAREHASSNNVDLLVAHGSTDAPVIDLRNAGGSVLINDLGYGEFSNYISLQPVSHVIDMTDASGTLMRRFKASLIGAGGEAATVVSSGFMDPAKNSNGLRFGLYFTTPEGGPLTMIPEEPIGIENIEASQGIVKVFPNPASNYIYLSGQGAAIQSVSIYDISGRKVKRCNDVNKIDIGALNSGVYFLSVQKDGKVLNYRFSKI